MKQFNTSLILGLLTISVWFFASVEFKESKDNSNNEQIVENIENALSETLTMDYKETTN